MASHNMVYLVATLDTKGEEIDYVKHLLSKRNVESKIVDISTKQPHSFNHIADISASTVAKYHPEGEKAVFVTDRGKAIVAMANAFKQFLIAQNDVDAILGLGGSGGTALITPAMQALPIGVPKLMVSTMASGDISGYIGASDIAMLYSVTDIAGVMLSQEKYLPMQLILSQVQCYLKRKNKLKISQQLD